MQWFEPSRVDIEDGVPGKDQEECGREEVEDGEKQERETGKEQPTNAQTHNGWHEDGILRHLQPWLVLNHAMSMHTIRRAKCMRKNSCEVFLSTQDGYGCLGSKIESVCRKKHIMIAERFGS